MTLFEYRDRFTLSEAESIRQFWHVKSDVELLALGSYFAEVMEAVAVEGRPDPPALSLILNCLHALDKLDRPQALVKAAFELRLMCLEGYEPLADACAVCGVPEPERPRFHLAEGVLHCGACQVGEGEDLPLEGGAPWPPCGTLSTGTPGGSSPSGWIRRGWPALGRVCEGFLLTQLDRGFSTLDFYKQLQGGL